MSYGAVQLDELFLKQLRLSRFVATFDKRFAQKWPVMAYLPPPQEPIVVGSYLAGQPAVALDDVVVFYTPRLVLQEVGEAQAVGLYPYTSARGSGIVFDRGYVRLSPRQHVEIDSGTFAVKTEGPTNVSGDLFNVAVNQIYISARDYFEAKVAGINMFARNRRMCIFAERIDICASVSIGRLEVVGPFFLKFLGEMYFVYVDDNGYLRAVKVTS